MTLISIHLTVFVSFLGMLLPTAARLQKLAYVGCYQDPGHMQNQGPWKYQASLYCFSRCQYAGAKFAATEGGKYCWCGRGDDSLPDQKYLVSDDECNQPCPGWPKEMCGGAKRIWSLYEIQDVSWDEESEGASTGFMSDGQYWFPAIPNSREGGEVVV